LVLAICDFVGSDKSLQFATRVLARGGKVVVTGLLGGNFSIAAAMFGIMAMTIEGALTGTLTEAQELLDLARAKNIAPIPTRNRPLGEAQAALDDLRAGRVVGRTVLTAQLAIALLTTGSPLAVPLRLSSRASQTPPKTTRTPEPAVRALAAPCPGRARGA
jgi:hypothetical protein